MSEKRFECVFKEHETKNSWSMIKDNQLDRPLYIKDVVGLLNEQQSTITALKEENEKLRQQLEIRTESDKYHQRMLLKWLCKDE